MPSLVSALLPHLENNRPAAFSAGPDAFYPYYDRQSLINLPASICHWLGVPGFGAAPLRDEILSAFGGPFRNVILMVVDGLGLGQLQRFSHPLNGQSGGRFPFWQQLLSEATLAPLSSIVPSTTATALTSLWTGQPPAAHGVMGYEMYLKEYGLIANMITHSVTTFGGDVGGIKRAGFNPETFLPVPTLGPHLGQHGVQAVAVQHAAIAHSGLSSMLFPGVKVIPFRTHSDLWVSLPNLLPPHNNAPQYTYIYWSELDDLSHKFGPYDRRVELEFSQFSTLLEGFMNEIRAQSRGDTLFLMTADHGHLHTPKVPLQDLRAHPELSACLHLTPSGESRLAYLHLKPGREKRLLDYVENTWPGRFVLVPSEQALAAGLFGRAPHHPRIEERLGDYLLIAQEDAYLWWPERENPLLGRHGGLSRIEMVVPLLGLVL